MAEDVVAAIPIYKKKILLLRRSPLRKHSPGLWEFPSGFLEKDEMPGAAALREMHEETSLEGDIIKKGTPFFVADDYGNWNVNPFLVEVRNNDVNITHEHTEFRWIVPKDIKKFKTVENIEEDLRSVGLI